MIPADINLIAVLAAAVVHQLIGAILWSPALLGRRRMRLAGRPEAALMQEGPRALLLTTPAALLTALGVATVLALTGTRGPVAAAGLGALLWLFFVATGMWGDALMEQRPLGIYLMNQVVQLASLVAMALTIALWP